MWSTLHTLHLVNERGAENASLSAGLAPEPVRGEQREDRAADQKDLAAADEPDRDHHQADHDVPFRRARGEGRQGAHSRSVAAAGDARQADLFMGQQGPVGRAVVAFDAESAADDLAVIQQRPWCAVSARLVSRVTLRAPQQTSRYSATSMVPPAHGFGTVCAALAR
jgi:hypothetical protein